MADLKLTSEAHLAMMNMLIKKKDEERELSLDRYRKADELMETAEEFALLGRNAASFLKMASDNTNDMHSMLDKLKSIIFKEDEMGATAIEFGDAKKKQIIESMKQIDIKDLEDDDMDMTPPSTTLPDANLGPTTE